MRSVPEKSADTRRLEKLMAELEIGQVLTYDTMTEALGRDARANCAGNIQSAKRIVASQGIILGAIPRVGYKRLDDTGILSKANNSTKSISRAANRNLNALKYVKFEQLSDNQKREHTAVAAQLGAVKLFSNGKSQKKIESHVKSSDMAIGETLAIFMKKEES